MTPKIKPERIWYKARLLPAATSVFTEAFYPDAKRTGARYVYFTQVNASPTNAKIIVASRFAQNSFRMLTMAMAKHCLEPGAKATRAEMATLNGLTSHLERNL